MTQAIPAGFHSVSVSFTFKDSQKAIDFYKKAFGAKVLDSLSGLDGRGIMHATMQIGDTIMMMGDESSMGGAKSAESLGGSPISLYIYVPDADAAFKQAVAAGGKVTMPLSDAFWGDRAGGIVDPFGHSWMIATHKQDLSPDQVRKGAETFFGTM